jgi:hypothetical protein
MILRYPRSELEWNALETLSASEEYWDSDLRKGVGIGDDKIGNLGKMTYC